MYARIVDDVIVDLSTNPADQFHPDLAAEFQEVPGNVGPGWRKVRGRWLAPDPETYPLDQLDAKAVE